jgi:predicted metal-dependent phosphoesterase TrpH
MLKIDLHVHTEYSDSRSTVSEILAAAKARDLDGIAITDHQVLCGIRAMRQLQPELLIIPGVEFVTPQGHLIGLGVSEDLRLPDPARARSAVAVAQWIRAVHGIVVIAHPCTPFFAMPRHVITQVHPDAIEVLNAHSPFYHWTSHRSRRLAAELMLPQVAGSDAHTWHTVGDAYTLIKAEPRVDAVIQAIRDGSTAVEGHSSSWRYQLDVFQRLVPKSLTRIPARLWRRANPSSRDTFPTQKH